MSNHTSANLRFSASDAHPIDRASSLSFDQTEHQLDSQRASQTMAVLPVIEPSADSPVMYPPHAARYQRLQALGEGGGGEVDLWHDQDIDRNVAVKRLKNAGAAEAVAQFVQEVHTTGQLEHPGIVPIYDVGQDAEGRYFFVMKHVEGENLEQIITQLRAGNREYLQRFSPEANTNIFMQILQSVKYAHNKGFIHCDIKPANIIVGPFGEVMVLDWGLAQQPRAATTLPVTRDRNARPVRLSGTPDYMSPEQAMGEQAGIDVRTDTYSLCVLFYELITHHYYLRPASTLYGRIAAVLSEEPLSALQMHHKYGAPPELTNFIRYGLAKNPAQRYQSVDEMIEKLQAVINGEIPVVCPCTGVKRFAHHYGDFLNHHPIIGLALMAVALLFTLFGLFEGVRLGLHTIS